jgi:hypothetical protein
VNLLRKLLWCGVGLGCANGMKIGHARL